MVGLYFICMLNLSKKLPTQFPKWLYHLTFPLMMFEGSSLSAISAPLGIVIAFYFTYLQRCVVI